MKPVCLKMQAFGPYEEMVTIEFDRLGEHPIFLITGPTGGGKTTILDGMCFALYCRATGGRRSWGSMRNTSVPDQQETMVDFHFLLGDEEYRFCRSQMVHRVRGSGRREIREEHSCYRRSDGEWELLVSGSETKLREQAQRFLGLTCEQFSQVIVLPQGDFLKLLRANSNNKAEILQTLFATKLWEDIAKRCKSMADEMTQKAGEYRGATQAILEREGVETREGLQEKNRQLTEAASVQEKQQAELQARLERQTEEVLKAKDIQQKLQKQAMLEQRHKELSKQREAMAKAQEQVFLGRKVQKVMPYVQAWERARQDSLEKTSRKAHADQVFRKAQQELSQAEQNCKEIPEWRTQAQACQRRQVQLQKAYENAVRLQEISGQLESKQQEIQEQSKKKAEAEDKLATAQKRLEKGRSYVEQAQSEMQKLPEWMQAVQDVETEWNRFQEYKTLQTAWENAKRVYDTAEQEREKCAVQEEVARNRLEQEEAHLRRDQASTLAATLQDGLPCPVCGSPSHPSPAGQPTGYDAKKLDLLRASVQELSQQLRQKEQASQVARGKLEQCTAQLQPHHEQYKQNPPNETVLQATLKQAKETLQQGQTAAKKFEQYRRAMEEIETGKAKAQQIREQAAERLVQLEKEAAVLRASQEEVARQAGTSDSPEQLQKQYEECFQEAERCTKKAKEAEQQFATAQTAFAVAQSGQAAAGQADQQAKTKLSQAQVVMEQETAKAGLPPNTDWSAIQTEEDFLMQLEQKIAEYERECHSVAEQCQAYREELADVTPPDVGQLEQVQKDLQTQSQQAAQHLGNLQRQLETGKESLTQFEQLSENGRMAEEKFAKIDRLAKLLQGKNPLKIPLQQFVLGIMLDDVLSYANRFFSMLSQGRYSLRRILGSTGGNALGGLDLEVLDAHAGGARSIETLSGGEQFLASLSLAFGLSDVVQSYSGSVRLDSIFIDEGFGSLDQNTLDTAMKALSQIQKLGRTIGIISHVSELKGRIAARLEVCHKPSGGAGVTLVCAE